MKLKRLELNGFKSFSEKTVVSFPKGISGVVGPNGCGKSNIVDAIKWVMGEQSPKQLRGKGMEDVIFAGLNNKSSVGMAEVSLVLDNDNGLMPPEFADIEEVVITRRLFRDGESEYAINNRPCRLKDITHLFMDTGVGSKAYSVIEQGRIGAIIDSKPEDRRHWIEEAAGISKYKSKKNESLRKLELTQQNLLRVGDVIAEIKRQMNSLYRQAKKAERFKEIRKQAKEVELTFYAREYQDLVLHIRQKEEELEEQQGQVENLGQDCQTHEDQLDQLQGRLLEIEKQLREKQERFYEQKADLQRQEDLIRQYQRELDGLGQEALEIQRELKEIENWISENKSLENALGEEVSSFAQKVFLEETRVKEQEKKVAESKKNWIQAQEKEEQAKDLLVTKLTELSRVRNMRASLIKQREDRSRRIVRQTEEKAQLIDRMNFLNTSVRETESLLTEQGESVRRHKEEIAQTQQQKAEEERTKKDLEIELLDLEQGLKQDQAQIGNLQEIRDNFQIYQNGVRALAQGESLADISEGSSFDQVLAEGLETVPGCETAVEATLGEALQALIIEDPQEAVRGIGFLKKTGKGKAHFLSMKTLPILEKGSVNWEEKGLVPLLSKVSVREECRPWLNLLLGSFVLVSDLAEGLEVWKNQQGRVSIVTMDGDLIDYQGIISGGSSGSPESGILYQKNLIHKLEERVGQWQGKIGLKREECQIKENEIRGQNLHLKTLEERKGEEEQKILGLEKSLFGYQEEKKPLQRRLQMLSLEEEEYRTLEEDEAMEEQTFKTQEEAVISDIEGLKKEIQEREEGVKLQENNLEEERQTLTQAYTQMSALKEKGEHIGKEWERLKESLDEKQGRRKRLLDKTEAGSQNHFRLMENISLGETAVAELGREVKALEDEIQVSNQTWEEMIRQKEELEVLFKEKRGQRADAERKENDLRIELAQMTMKIDHIKEQTLEQFGQPLEEVVKDYLTGRKTWRSLRKNEGNLRKSWINWGK